MDTIVAKITNDSLTDKKIYEQAGKILREGGLVAFPTETVYGLGADALDEEASAKIYAAKGRPSDNPLIVHIADIEALYKLSCEVPDKALKLADKFWPGPLTMILKKSDIVPDSITGGLGTVAIRMPSHKVAAELIRTSGVYIAAPSANTSGKPSPTRASHVIKDLSGKIDMIIEDDTVDIGVESTIIDLSEEVPTILRPGYITKEMFEEVIGGVRIDPAITEGVKSGVVPKAPGMKYKHYAPDADLKIVEGDEAKVVEYINDNVNRLISQGYKVAVMTTEEGKHNYNKGIIVSMGHKDDELSAARHLYAVLREFDNQNVDYVFTESFETDNDGRAVMNCGETTAAKVDEVVMKMLKEAYAKAVTYIRENMDILDEAAEFLIQRETITGKEFMEIFNKYKNPVEESDKNVSETAENDAEISEAEVKTDSEIKTEEENTSTYNTGYAQWVEDDDDEE